MKSDRVGIIFLRANNKVWKPCKKNFTKSQQKDFKRSFIDKISEQATKKANLQQEPNMRRLSLKQDNDNTEVDDLNSDFENRISLDQRMCINYEGMF